MSDTEGREKRRKSEEGCHLSENEERWQERPMMAKSKTTAPLPPGPGEQVNRRPRTSQPPTSIDYSSVTLLSPILFACIFLRFPALPNCTCYLHKIRLTLSHHPCSPVHEKSNIFWDKGIHWLQPRSMD